MTKRLWLVLLTILLVVAACGGDGDDDEFVTPEQPQLLLVSADSQVSGLTLVACWPEGKDNLVCDINSEAETIEPDGELVVISGELLSVEVEGDAQDPDQIVVTSRETDADGDPLLNISLDAGETFVVNFGMGPHVLEVTAYYDDLEGTAATLTQIFTVTVAESVALDATATPTVVDEASPQPTQAAASDTPTPAGNDVTISPTDTTATSRVLTEEAAQATGTVAPPAATPTSTSMSDDETNVPEATATEISISTSPTDTPTVTFTPTATFTPSNTPTSTATNTPTATFTPSNTPTPTSTPTFTPTATPVGAPPIVLRAAGIDYDPAGTVFCRPNAEGECIETAINAERVQVSPGSAITITIDGVAPQAMRYTFLNRQTFDPLLGGERQSSNAYLFNVELSETGLYLLQVELDWPDRFARYFYQVRVR